jgi:hypothetical protein
MRRTLDHTENGVCVGILIAQYRPEEMIALLVKRYGCGDTSPLVVARSLSHGVTERYPCD